MFNPNDEMNNDTLFNDTDYDYDIETSMNTFNWVELGPVLVVYSITFCLGLTGNLIIIASTLCPRLRPLPSTPTNIFLGGLASADLILILFCIPVKMMSKITGKAVMQLVKLGFFILYRDCHLLAVRLSAVALVLLCEGFHFCHWNLFYGCDEAKGICDEFPKGWLESANCCNVTRVSAKIFSFSWTMGMFLCKSVHYMQSVTAICSVLTLTAMSIERYYAIVHPMRAQYTCTISQARRIVMITWSTSFWLAIPMLFIQRHKAVGSRQPAYWCVRDTEASTLWRIHEVYMLLLVLVVPLAVMAFCYTAICWEIWRVMKRRYHMTSRHALQSPSNNASASNGECIPMTQRKSRRGRFGRRGDDARTESESRTMKQVVKMLVAVVVLFAVCWSPLLIDNVLTAYGVLPSLKYDHFKHLNTAFQLMAYFNSCINPIVYGFMSKHFRESFLAAACGSWWCCCPRRVYTPPVKRHPSLSQTRTTSVRWA